LVIVVTLLILFVNGLSIFLFDHELTQNSASITYQKPPPTITRDKPATPPREGAIAVLSNPVTEVHAANEAVQTKHHPSEAPITAVAADVTNPPASPGPTSSPTASPTSTPTAAGQPAAKTEEPTSPGGAKLIKLNAELTKSFWGDRIDWRKFEKEEEDSDLRMGPRLCTGGCSVPYTGPSFTDPKPLSGISGLRRLRWNVVFALAIGTGEVDHAANTDSFEASWSALIEAVASAQKEAKAKAKAAASGGSPPPLEWDFEILVLDNRTSGKAIPASSVSRMEEAGGSVWQCARLTGCAGEEHEHGAITQHVHRGFEWGDARGGDFLANIYEGQAVVPGYFLDVHRRYTALYKSCSTPILISQVGQGANSYVFDRFTYRAVVRTTFNPAWRSHAKRRALNDTVYNEEWAARMVEAHSDACLGEGTKERKEIETVVGKDRSPMDVARWAVRGPVRDAGLFFEGPGTDEAATGAEELLRPKVDVGPQNCGHGCTVPFDGPVLNPTPPQTAGRLVHWNVVFPFHGNLESHRLAVSQASWSSIERAITIYGHITLDSTPSHRPLGAQ